MTTHVVKVGSAEVIELLDLSLVLDHAMLFPGRDQQEILAYRELYPQSYTSEGRYQTYASAYVIRSGGRTVLVDTGLGPRAPEWLGGAQGRLLDDMREKGVRPEDIDVVVCTHLHIDHIGWNVQQEAGSLRPTFPRARYYLPKADWDYFTAPERIQQSGGTVSLLPLKELGVLELFSGETKLAEGVSTMPTPGHTPGHTSILIASQGERALIAGDLANHPLQVDKTDWSSSFDTDAAQAAETRRRVFDFLEREGVIVAFGHFPPPNLGRLIRWEGKRVFRAL
jgi:glyoxylase-like metal-dependent hydrolase (beta-lactamase superfamily II)